MLCRLPVKQLSLDSHRTVLITSRNLTRKNIRFGASSPAYRTNCGLHTYRSHSQRVESVAVQRSQIGYTSIGLAVFGIVAAASLAWSYTSSSVLSDQLAEEPIAAKLVTSTFFDDMTVAMPPGRPGTLTDGEEVKLRELWNLTLRVFGVINSPAEAATATVPATPEPAKGHKKNRLSIFSRRKDEDETPTSPVAASPTTANIIASVSQDDKHGLAQTFQQALATMTPEEMRTSFWSMVKHDHPDALLLRFLRARKWDVNAALVMAISALHWRAKEAHVDSDVMYKGEGGMLSEAQSSDPAVKKEGNDFMAQIRLGKSFLHGFDKEGRPVCICRARLHRAGEQSEQSLERFTVYTIETARLFLRPPVDTATIVFDLTDFSMANMDYTPVKFMIKCFEANYPESLGAVLVHKAPWIFQGIWRVIKGWLDPVVAAKVHFTNNLNDLSEFIDSSTIISELGGPQNFTYTYNEPTPGENAKMEDAAGRSQIEAERTKLSQAYEGSILSWIGVDARGEKVAAGGTDMGAARKQRDEIAARLRENYYVLDPYVRARSLYDRDGSLKMGSGSIAPPA